MLSNLLQAILGKNGDYMLEYGDLHTAFCDGLFRSFYRQRGRKPKISLVRNLVSGAAKPSRKLLSYYIAEGGYELLCGDVDDLIQSCTSLHRLRCIAWDTHDITCTYGVDVGQLRRHGERADLTREAVAEYLTDVLYYALRESLAS